MIALSLLIVFAFAGCSLLDDPKIDAKKFKAVNAAALSVGDAVTSGVDYARFKGLVERLAGEISHVKASSGSDREKELLKDYENLLGIYRDGLVLWKYKLEAPRYGFMPRGRIWVAQDVEPIVEKYRFSTKTHVYEPTQKAWKSISEDSLGVIWMNARSQMAIINSITRNSQAAIVL